MPGCAGTGSPDPPAGPGNSVRQAGGRGGASVNSRAARELARLYEGDGGDSGGHRISSRRRAGLGSTPIVKLLLDTHIWLWSLLEPDRLSRRVAQALKNPANELWLSPISTWEVGALVRKRRLELGQEVGAWVARALSEVPLKEAPLTHEIALEAPSIALPHQDSADRFLAATAKVLDLTLVTEDARLLEVEGFSVLANR